MEQCDELTEQDIELLQTSISDLKKLGRYHAGIEALDKKHRINRAENEAQNG